MKRNIKTVMLAVATATVMALAGCSSSQPTTQENANAQNESDGQAENTETSAEGEYKIGILQLVEHDALDNAREGFKDALAEEGIKASYDEQNAQNDQSNLKTISQKFVNDKVDLVYAIATPSAQSMVNETQEIPILGSAITDYVAAGLVESNEAPGANLSGTSDRTPVKRQLELLQKILPEAATVGIMYNSSEDNSRIQAETAQAACDELGLKYELGTVTNVNDIPQVTQSLMGKVDALYVPTDNTFASAMTLVSDVANQNGAPIICGEIGMCKGGGLATVGIDYYKLGKQTGAMAAKVLGGEDISAMPIEFPADEQVCINMDVAKQTGVTFPQEVLDSAAIIIENGEIIEK